MLLNFVQHSKKNKQKACDNRVTITWVSLILEVDHKPNKNRLINFSLYFLSFFLIRGAISEALEPLRSSGNGKK